MGSETRGRDYDQPATGVSIPEDAGSAAQTMTEEDERSASRRSRRFPSSRLTAGERNMIAQKARDVDFPVAMRGYERSAVDRYVQQVNRLIAELEMSASPESAVRHALEEVSEETHDLLQRAHQTAEEITAKSRSRSDERLQQAEREAAAAREAAAREILEMRETVERETASLRETAEREAGELLAKARREADELHGTSTREILEMRETVERETASLRETAEREAGELLAKARREADELHGTSTRKAQELRETSERQALELRERAAHEAEELRTAARRDSDELRTTVQRTTDEQRRTSQRDAEQMREAAETYVRELYRNSEVLWRERRRLVDDMGSVGKQMADIAEAEARRFEFQVPPTFPLQEQMADIAEAEARRFERIPGPADVSPPGDEPVPEEELAAAAGPSTAITEEPDQLLGADPLTTSDRRGDD
jgi:DivIVA domain-containing protein